jgi:4-hydroxybenzoate polyprenyltransferase
MKKLNAFIKLIRWPNLVFIILTQIAFYFFVLTTTFNTSENNIHLSVALLCLLIISSVLIAAAGYIINDYFDINIDLINKPSKQIIGNTISKQQAIFWHFVFSLIGIFLSFYISVKMQQQWWWLGWCNFFVVSLLVIYSSTFKKKLLIGNVLISLLTAWVIIVLVMSEFQLANTVNKGAYSKFFRIGLLYASFAFIVTLIREVVKDMEDVIGDMQNGAKTMPIVWGFPVSKVFVAIWTFILIALILILQLYVLQYQWYFAIIYALLFIVVPLVFSLKVLIAASSTLHYHMLSTIYKVIMLTGILSMIFFKVYA